MPDQPIDPRPRTETEPAGPTAPEPGSELSVEALYDALAAIDVAVVVYDAEDRLQAISPLYRQMFPEERPVLNVGTSYAETLRFFAEANDRVRRLGHANFEAYLAQELKRHRTPYMRQVYRRHDGRWVEARKVPLPGGGVVGLWRDITAEVAAERQLVEAKEVAETASRAKSDFLALISHELRTPLNAIIGFADMLERGDEAIDPAVRRDYARQIATGGRRLLSMINDILDLTRISATETALTFRPVPVGPACREAVRQAMPRAEGRGVSLRLDLAQGLAEKPAEQRAGKGAGKGAERGPEIRADPVGFDRMLVHLIDNAVQASRPGTEVLVRVSEAAGGATETGTAEPAAPMLSVEVIDRGRGLTETEIAQVFEPFFRTGEPLTREAGGVGLGLPLVKAMAELHGGRLALDSRPGQGTTARLLLPGLRQPAA